MTPDELAMIDRYARDAFERAGIVPTDQDVSTFAAYVRIGPNGCYIAGGLPRPAGPRWTVRPPSPDDVARTIPDLLGGGVPLPLPPERLALDLAAANLVTAPANFRAHLHVWSAPHNAS